MKTNTESLVTSVTLFLTFLAAAFLVSLVFALPVTWLWNWLIPSIVGLRTITWLEALGLTLLTRMLFTTGSENTKKQ